jgi:N-acetylneuraminic acid mutarotase
MDPMRITRRSAAIVLRISLTAGLLAAVLVRMAGGASPTWAAASSPRFVALAPSGSTELQTARYSAVAAPLPNGRVLIAGGKRGRSFLASAELFNPASDAFTALPASGATELQTARDGAVAAVLPNGQVLIAGGYNGSSSPHSADGYLQSAELFNPAGDTFTALPASGATELQTARESAVAAVLPNGQVLIAGGYNVSGFLASAELFNPSSDTFTALLASGNSELQTARNGAVAAVLPNGQVLIAGGYSYNVFDPDYTSVLRSAELFNPASDTFKALAASGSTELQTARESAVAAVLPNGQVLIAGGDSARNSALRSAELFNPASDTFKPLPPSGATELQTARLGAVAAPLLNGGVLIAGGYNRSGYLQRAELYSPMSRRTPRRRRGHSNHSRAH